MSFNAASIDFIDFPVSKQEGLMSLIEKEKSDIVCFQELSFDNLRKIRPQLDSIYGSCDILKGDNQFWRLRFYSRYPLRQFSRHYCEGDISLEGKNDKERSEISLFQKQMNLMSCELEIIPNKWVKVYSGHLRSSAYSNIRLSMRKDEWWIKGMPQYWRNYKVGKRMRKYEADNIRRFVDKTQSMGMPVLVVGDLNDWCGSDCLNTIMGDDLKDAWWEGGNGFGWTYFGWHLRLRLDHILYSDELELVDVKVVDTDLSDHKPLMARFRLKK